MLQRGAIMEPSWNHIIIGKIMKSWKNIGKTQDPSREVGGIWISRHSVLFGSHRYYLFLPCLRHPLNDAKTGWPTTGCAARLQGRFFFASDVWMLGASLCQPQGHLSELSIHMCHRGQDLPDNTNPARPFLTFRNLYIAISNILKF